MSDLNKITAKQSGNWADPETWQSGGRDVCPFCGAELKDVCDSPLYITEYYKCDTEISTEKSTAEMFHAQSVSCVQRELGIAQNELVKLRAVAEWALKFLACGINSDIEEVDQELLIYCIEGIQESLRDAGYLPLTPPAEVGNEIAPE